MKPPSDNGIFCDMLYPSYTSLMADVLQPGWCRPLIATYGCRRQAMNAAIATEQIVLEPMLRLIQSLHDDMAAAQVATSA